MSRHTAMTVEILTNCGAPREVIDIVRSSETLEPLVLYRALYGEGGLWVRPYPMFVEQVPGKHGPQARFARIDD